MPRSIPWGTGASLLLHGALALALLFLTPVRDLVLPEPPPVNVELVTAEQFAALQPASPAPPAPPPAVVTPAPGEVAAAPGERLPESGPLTPDLPESPTFTATQFYSAALLRQPDMQRIRQGLRGFDDSERMVQICNIEALEQIRRAAPAFDPDTMVAYAMSDMIWQNMTLTAAGGAFRSRRKWYGVAFHCTVATGYEGVTAFDFKVGDPIPESEWEEHSLNAADAEDD